MIALPARWEPDATRPFALFVGRLSVSKGIVVLLEAARRTPEIPIRVAADTSNLGIESADPAECRTAGAERQGGIDALYAGRVS